MDRERQGERGKGEREGERGRGGGKEEGSERHVIQAHESLTHFFSSFSFTFVTDDILLHSQL